MKALLVVAHGSRRENSNQEVMSLVEAMRESRQASTSQAGFDMIDVAFLELAHPSICESIDACAKQGATQIIVLPYFLSAGRHVAEDIPNEVQQSVVAHPNIDFQITGHIGSIKAMPRLLLVSVFDTITHGLSLTQNIARKE